MKKRSSSQSAWALLASSVSQARVEAHRLRHMVNRGQKAVDQSTKRDHLYEVAGDLIVGVPQRLSKLESLLDRTSYALSIMGEEFFKGRLPLEDRTMVDEAVKFSQSPFPSSRRVARKFMASSEGVLKRVEEAFQKGKINQDEYYSMIDNINNLSNQQSSLIYSGFSFRPNISGNTKVKTFDRAKNKNQTIVVPISPYIRTVSVTPHAQYRLELRDVSDDHIDTFFRGMSAKLTKASYDLKNPLRRNTDGAQWFKKFVNMRGRGSLTYYAEGINLAASLSPSPIGSTNSFNVDVVTFHYGKPRGDIRMRVAYRQPASQLPGISTYVTDDSKKNLTPNTSKGEGGNADSREKSGPQVTDNKQQALPIKNDHSEKRDQKPPVSQTDGKGTSRPQYNTPPESERAEGGRPIHKEKVRTRSMPGDQYGTPYKDDGYGLSRRTMKAFIKRISDLYLSQKDER